MIELIKLTSKVYRVVTLGHTLTGSKPDAIVELMRQGVLADEIITGLTYMDEYRHNTVEFGFNRTFTVSFNKDYSLAA